MKMVKTIKIGAHTFDVLFPHSFFDNNQMRGMVNYDLLEIRIAGKTIYGPDFKRTKILETLLHEVLHSVDTTYLNGELSERQTAVITEGLVQVLLDNPEFTKMYLPQSNQIENDVGER